MESKNPYKDWTFKEVNDKWLYLRKRIAELNTTVKRYSKSGNPDALNAINVLSKLEREMALVKSDISRRADLIEMHLIWKMLGFKSL